MVTMSCRVKALRRQAQATLAAEGAGTRTPHSAGARHPWPPQPGWQARESSTRRRLIWELVRVEAPMGFIAVDLYARPYRRLAVRRIKEQSSIGRLASQPSEPRPGCGQNRHILKATVLLL